MSRTYGTPHIAVYIYQPLKWQATFVLPLWGVFGGIFANSHFLLLVSAKKSTEGAAEYRRGREPPYIRQTSTP